MMARVSRSIFAYRNLTSLAVVVLTSACTPAPNSIQKPTAENTPSGPSTEWKEGYGGDGLEIEVLRAIEAVCRGVRELRPAILNNALEAKDAKGREIDVAHEICQLQKQGEIKVEIVEQPIVSGEKKDMANFPYEKPRRLQVKRDWWTANKHELAKTESGQALLLHEILPLIGLSDLDYARSTRLLTAMMVRHDSLPAVICEERRIEAVMSAANSEVIRLYSNYLGSQLCEAGRNVISKYARSTSLGKDLKVAIQHHYAFGVFQRLARAETSDDMAEITGFLSASFDKLPDALTPLGYETCKEIGEVRPSEFGCGSMIHVVLGATSDFKERLTGYYEGEKGIEYFDRANFGLVKLLEEKALMGQKFAENPLFGTDGKISVNVLSRVIEAQNWSVLYLLGIVHSKLDRNKSKPRTLLDQLNFAEVFKNSVPPELPGHQLYKGRLRTLMGCTAEDLRYHSIAVIDGYRADPLQCRNSLAI